MKNIYFLIMTFIFISCDMGDNYKGFVQDNDTKSAIVVELADSYLAPLAFWYSLFCSYQS